MITIVDYGMGNLGSIQNMLKRIKVDSYITNDLEHIKNADKLILPGVGAFDQAMQRINKSGMYEVLSKKALIEKKPILGICLGMQLMTRGSEEGNESGFGWIPADTHKFPRVDDLKVPHMGWNTVNKSSDSNLTINLEVDTRFYFVHSYYVKVDETKNSIFKSIYGLEFDSGIQSNNIYGVQFHPEKSHHFGMNLLINFAKI